MASASTTASRIQYVPVTWLPVLRASVIICLIVVDVCFVLGIPYFYDHLTTLCTLPDCQPLVLTADDVTMLESVGLSASFYAISHIVIEILNVLFVNLFCIYYLRRFMNHWLGYVASFVFVLFIIMPNVIWALMDAYPSIRFIGEILLDITNTAFFVLLYIFPTAKFVPRWSILFLGLGLYEVLGRTVAEYYEDFNGTGLDGIFLSPFFISLVAGIMFQIYRYFRVATPTEKRQSRLVVFGFLGLVMGVFGWGFFMEYLAFQPDMPRAMINLLAMPIIMVITVVPFPILLTVAIIEDQLWDIDLIINRTIVYTAITVITLITYVFIITLMNALFGLNNSLVTSLFATVTIALSFQIIRQTVQQGVNRLMFGQREEPQTILLKLSQQLQTAIVPEDLLRISAETIGKSLKIPYVAIMIRHGKDNIKQTEYGNNGMPTRAFPLVHQNEAVGDLIIGQRSPGESLNSADELVLSSVAQQLGAVVLAVRLQSDLRNAREKLVITREEERRRLRRDLHDGLGPSLASLPLKIDAAIDLIEQDQNASVNLLIDVKNQSRSLVADVRRVVHNLRPPALDDLGLVAALRGAIAQIRNYPNGLHIQLHADTMPDHLSAAVEAAAYHITLEAVTNVAKHAQAKQCEVHLIYSTTHIEIQVHDDGVGLPNPVVSNVGLQSMRERAEELGGQFQIESHNGTQITVYLPLPTGVSHNE